jgi:dTMP kinase
MFVVIDGLDGSGKSTQAEMLVEHLRRIGKTYVLRSHPSDDNFFGIKGREFLFVEGKKAHFTASLFYFTDVIRSITLYAWRRVDYVIFVRYLMGTAYLPSPVYKLTYSFLAKLVPMRGSLIYLKVSPDEAFRRVVSNRIKAERFETMDELSKTSDKALNLVADGKWVIVDGNRSIPEVQDEIRLVVGIK